MENDEVEIEVGTLDRMLEIYDQIANSDDIAYKTAAFLTFSHYYSYSLKISNELNGRQGRNRITVSYDTVKLMSYSMDTDVNNILDKHLTELFVGILNTYLSDKQELPVNKPRVATMIGNRVKTLMIMLVSTNQYGLIPMLNIPPYMLKSVVSLFDSIQAVKESILNSWIEWLNEHENKEMADVVRSIGNEFWGSDITKPNVIFENHFRNLMNENKIHNYEETYNVYLQFRSEYIKSTRNILPSKIYDIFGITPDAYTNMRRNVYNEIAELYAGEEDNVNVIKRLLYEQ